MVTANKNRLPDAFFDHNKNVLFSEKKVIVYPCFVDLINYL